MPSNRTTQLALSVFTLAGLSLVSGRAAAQDKLAAGIAKRDAATAGSTDVAAQGFEAPVVVPEDEKNARELGVSVGGLASSGNSRSMAVTSGLKLRVREEKDQLSAAAAGNFARSASAQGEPMETTVENYQGRARYDRFLGAGIAAFMAVSLRRDRFQGLDLRLNIDPGFAYYFVDNPQHQLWSELGYDLQYDLRSKEALDEATAQGIELNSSRVRHSARLFAGYEGNLNDVVSIGTGFEYLQGVPETELWRLNWDGGVTSSVSGRFSIATTVSVKYDHRPLPGIENTDITTAISLVYQLL